MATLKRCHLDMEDGNSSFPITKYPKLADDHSFPSTYPAKQCLKMVAGSFYLPKDNPKKPQGEDAHFICLEKQTLGVADGVGGWAKKGIDGGEYARQLMKNSLIAVQNQPRGAVDLKKVLREGYLQTKAQGSSTACIITLNEQKRRLHAINVGDSGFILFRNNRFLYRSPAMQHRFNRPYQLGNSSTSDRPESAVVSTIWVMPGDIIIVGTDGLFDNMWPEEIEKVLDQRSSTKASMEPEELAWNIAKLALHNSLNRHSVSPFSNAARMAGKEHIGGKVDDITVVVAHIV
ncbi:Protein phosphatase 2C family protein [Quillaja saponaria]|uniref:Protein phosphatase n=1 Tax=Quillaja saponaria TaxID=32244 RepID=A0AAD7PB52_QUISA|nr:Protein phosphatase 2C family protein [Quillaja saponaria]